jgi:hypothetical protein
MHHRPSLWTAILVCLAFALAGAPAGTAWAAKHKKPAKHWPSKKPAHKPKPSSGGAPKAAPAEEDDEEDSGGEAAEGADDEAEEAPKPKAAAKSPSKKVKMDAREDANEDAEDGGDREKRASSDESDDADESSGETVVRRKAKKPVETSGGAAPIALVLDVGARALHRNFDFNDPLSDFDKTVPAPGSYSLPAGPVPFIAGGFYPLAFAGRGFLANIGIIGRYEKLISTTTVTKSIAADNSVTESKSTTSGQEWEAGLRVRFPLDTAELGLAGAYGLQSFHASSVAVGPTNGAAVPNVDYTFYRLGADGAVRIDAFTIGGHVGTRLVPKTGSLAKLWFPTTKTTSIEAGLFVGYRLTPLFQVIAGVDFLRYGFDFVNPGQRPVVAGGAVDQYISGYGALRVTVPGS